MKVRCDACGLVVHRPKAGMRHTGCAQGGSWVVADAKDRVSKKSATPAPVSEARDEHTAPAPVRSKPKKVNKRSSKPRRREEVIEETIREPFQQSPTFIPNADYFLWNRGLWRGWAVGAVQKVDPLFTQVLLDYRPKIKQVLTQRIRQDVNQGTIFIADPRGVLELIALQSLRLLGEDDTKDRLVREALQHLENAQHTFEQLASNSDGSEWIQLELPGMSAEELDAAEAAELAVWETPVFNGPSAAELLDDED